LTPNTFRPARSIFFNQQNMKSSSFLFLENAFDIEQGSRAGRCISHDHACILPPTIHSHHST